MSGSPLDEFTTLMASQGPAWASGAEKLVNDAIPNTFTLPRIMSGKNMLEYVQGGDQITDTIFLSEKSTWQRYNPNVEITRKNPQTGTTWTVPWAFGTAHMSWTKQEIGLNKDTSTKKFRAQRYKAVMYQKHQNLQTDICKNWESEMWAVPNHDLMESATPSGPRQPLSIPCGITESTAGIPLGSAGTAWGGAATVQNINVTNNPNWDNQRETYGIGTPDFRVAIEAAEIFAPMSRLVHKLRFDRLPKGAQYSDKTSSPHVILCSLLGISSYENALRLNQDTFRGIGKMSGQDPDYNNPTFRNIPLDYIAELDTAALYATTAGTSLATETTTPDLVGPRYYFINGEYLNFVVHSENYLVLEEPIRPSGQPFTRVQDVDCWNNLIFRSRKRHGILSPAVDWIGPGIS